MINYKQRLNLENSTAIITGGAGLLGPEHAIGLARYGASIILVDLKERALIKSKEKILSEIPTAKIYIETVDITIEDDLTDLCEKYLKKEIYVDILINNAAINPKMDSDDDKNTGMVEDYDIKLLIEEINVGIIGTFICCKIFGKQMAEKKGGSIINIASDLAIQAPDQRVYSKTNNIEDVRHFKPIGYPIVKSSMLGLNRYLASYWAHKGVRVNCLVPGAVMSTQSEDLVKQIKTRVPLNRLAKTNEYQDAIVFLASDASSYMTGSELIIDGGRSIW